MLRRPAAIVALLLANAVVVQIADVAMADDAWNPFSTEPETSRPPPKKPAAIPAPGQPYLPPLDDSRPTDGATPYGAAATPYERPRPYGSTHDDSAGRGGPAVGERDRAVERGELAPIMSPDGSGLPLELWQGVDMGAFEQFAAKVPVPSRSPVLQGLWKRLITSNSTPPLGAQGNAKFDALRADLLFLSGLLNEMSASLAKSPNAATDPVLAPLAAKAELAIGNRERACGIAKTFGVSKSDLPKPMRAEALMTLGYCVATAGNAAGAGLAADVARDEGLQAHAHLNLLDAVASGGKVQVPHDKAISIVEYRLLELAKSADHPQIAERAGPALLVLLARDDKTAADLRLAAGEAAARLNIIAPEELAGIYRANPASGTAEALLAVGQVQRQDGPKHRAALFKAAEGERNPMKRVRLIRAFLDDARRNGLYLPALQISANAADMLAQVPEIGWFAETGVEINLAAGRYDKARAWARFGGGLDRPGGAQGSTLEHWLGLTDVVDPGLQPRERGSSLGAVEELALRGRFTPDQLHRLVTVLDALDYNVPMRLWETASRTPQPTSGHLPATGILAQLQDASKKKEFGRTVLLAMDTLGPNGAEGAHMIALGDSIRGLRRAGLDTEARRLAFEALFGSWPRSTGS